jgi:ATP-dependent protease ClpP protease subunit
MSAAAAVEYGLIDAVLAERSTLDNIARRTML